MYKYICAQCQKEHDLKKGLTGYEEEGYCECGGNVIYQNPYLDSNLLRDSYTKKIKTIGQQADENVRRNGRAWAEEELAKQKTKRLKKEGWTHTTQLDPSLDRRKAEGVKIDQDLANATPAELKRYIEDGTRPTPKAAPSKEEVKAFKKEKIKEKLGKKTKIITTG